MPTPVEVLSLIAAAVATVTAVRVLSRRRTSPLAVPLVLMLVGASEWAVARGLLHVAESSVAATVTLHYAVFPGAAVVVGAAFWYFVVLSGRSLTRRVALLLLVHPALLAVVLTTNPWHHAFLRIDTTGDTVVIGLGPLYWVHTAYSYTLLVVGIALALRALPRAVPGHRHVYIVAALAATIPAIGNVLTTVIATRSENLHLTPVFFLISAAIWGWVERFREQSRGVPVTTRQVLDALTDAVVVLDPCGRLLDVNGAARALLRDPEGSLPDDNALEATWRDRLAPELGNALSHGGTSILTMPSGRVLDVRVTQIADLRGTPVGSVVALRDVTEIERLRTELAHQATRDALTGLHNRRAFEQHLAQSAAAARENGAHLSVALLDLDHFKAVNDSHGHAAGDRVLVAVAKALTESAWPGELVARIGGEELALLLPGVTGRDAARRADEARSQCARTAVPVRDGEIRVTVSAGVAALAPDQTVDDLLRAADDALYAAKAQGRDRVEQAAGLSAWR
ncbi:diguanylate cyclase [Cellulomonas sp. 179-A 4D5 NHS]|uniref:histidine kinase N-terminal 7TM domain-containing diguanylate cyclase n=1 Tax=Cellulomonas sp. 179-A 4D5 NHS TaxID=3142378 RepID=UPI0039A18645